MRKLTYYDSSSCTLWWRCSHGCKGWPERQAGSYSRRSHVENKAQCSSEAHHSWCTVRWLRCAGWPPSQTQTLLRSDTLLLNPHNLTLCQPNLALSGGGRRRQHWRRPMSLLLAQMSRSQGKLWNEGCPYFSSEEDNIGMWLSCVCVWEREFCFWFVKREMESASKQSTGKY